MKTKYICMTLKSNIPNPKPGNKLESAICPICGRDCWKLFAVQEILNMDLNFKAVCTECALKMGVKNDRYRTN